MSSINLKNLTLTNRLLSNNGWCQSHVQDHENCGIQLSR